MRVYQAGILFLAASVFAGCDEPKSMGPGAWEDDPPPLPADAPLVNCVAPGHRLPAYIPYCTGFDSRRFKEAEAVVIARCVEVRQYATVRRGNWDFLWYLVACDVIRVERGRWPHDRVVFCYYGTRPTPESGIRMLFKTALCPYVEGRVVALALEPEAEPPRVLGQERRSRLPPHGRPTYMDAQGESGERLHHRLWRAVRDFAEQEGWPKVTGASHFEVTDEAYLVEVILRRPDGESVRRAVAVDKETFSVHMIP